MKIRGFVIGKRATPLIKISLRAARPRIAKALDFMLDTGSDITFIARKDAIELGISFKKLGKPMKSIKGIVSKAKRYPINAKLHFMTEERKIAKFGPMEIYIMETDPECPSVLGRDFMLKYNFRLFYDPNKKEVYLEK